MSVQQSVNPLRQMHEAHKARRARMNMPPSPVSLQDPEPEPTIEAVARRPFKRMVELPRWPFLNAEGVCAIKPKILMTDIHRVVCEYFGISHIDLISSRRTGNLTFPRHLTAYLCKKHTTCSLPMIAAKLGGRDHTTVRSSCLRIEAMIERNDSKTLMHIENLEAELLR